MAVIASSRRPVDRDRLHAVTGLAHYLELGVGSQDHSEAVTASGLPPDGKLTPRMRLRPSSCLVLHVSSPSESRWYFARILMRGS